MQFPQGLVLPSNIWLALIWIGLIVPWMILALIMLGFAGFFLPRRVRPFPFAIAMIGVVLLLLDPNPRGWFRFTKLAVPSLATAAIALIATLLPERRPLTGFCRKCKYNLTGNKSGICPECGTPTPPKKNFDALVKNLEAIE
jgi:peptidoglycan/LPS O-acetylase OafA/YrhL